MSRKHNKRQTEQDFEFTPYREVPEVKPRTKKQADYLRSIENNVITFGIGVAGSGKSHIALAYAARELESKNIHKIIVTRPIVEAGEKLGFLPGEIGEKTLPYMLPMLDILNKRLGKSTVEYHLKRGNIEFKPLAYLRGTSFENAVVILDEAQNTTESQMKLFLTRIGENCKVIIDGDVEQKDIHERSGLVDGIKRLNNIPSVGIVQFDFNDVVRSGICKQIIKAYMGAQA
jgi:phosphate starvation-inducible PhoH-like protein